MSKVFRFWGDFLGLGVGTVLVLTVKNKLGEGLFFVGCLSSKWFEQTKQLLGMSFSDLRSFLPFKIYCYLQFHLSAVKHALLYLLSHYYVLHNAVWISFYKVQLAPFAVNAIKKRKWSCRLRDRSSIWAKQRSSEDS